MIRVVRIIIRKCKTLCKMIKCEYKKICLVLLYGIYSIYAFCAKCRIKRLISKGEQVRVGFIGYASAPSVDALSDVCNVFETDERFNCFAVVVPYTHDYKDAMIKKYKMAYDYACTKCNNVLHGYDINTDVYINYKNQFDVVFFEIEYDWIRPEFKVENYRNSLTYFIPYGPFLADNMEHHFSHRMMSIVHRIFPTANNEIPMLKKYSNIYGLNIMKQYLGYPKNDKFLNRHQVLSDVWKKAKNGQKRIIWAPHHTWAHYSNFLTYADFFLNYIQMYDDISIAFKPHPALRDSLIKVNGWTSEQVDFYYSKWKEVENGELCEGEWFDLFMTSDAMIMDSISFMMEYSMTFKPSCVLYREDKTGRREAMFNECGEELYKQLYHAKNEGEIIQFLSMIKNNQDCNFISRLKFLKENFISPNEELAANNIYNFVLSEISIDETKRWGRTCIN